MRLAMNGLRVLFVAFSLQIFQALPAIAQVQIVPANNGTGTVVLPNGDRIDIRGGTTSGNGANVFHSFQGFNVQTGQTANFVVLPQVQNILGGVTGGDPSVINGTIQVTGSNANLYLLNPAGFIFGNNAQLNVNGSFTASTARTAWFGDRNLDIYNPNYSNLTGNLTGLEFDPNNPAAIVNSGNLTVDEGKSVTLAASTVVNTGTISAPNGSVGIVAIPDGRLRLNVGVEGLSFEFPQPKDAQGNDLPVKALDLPSLLTTGKLDSSSGISLNSQGQAQLTNSQTVIPNTAGTAIVSGNVSVASTVVNPSQVTPKIQILGDRVGLVSANIDASGVNGGGSVFIGGDFQGKGVIPNALMTFVSADSTIKADALQSGNGGRVIVWADNAARFFGSISARGGAISGDGGFVEVSGKQNLVFDGKVDLNAAIGKGGTLLLDPDNIIIANNVLDSAGVPVIDGGLPDIFETDLSGTITISQATLEALASNQNIILEATNNITIGPLTESLVESNIGLSPVLTFQTGTGLVNFKAAGGTFSMPSNSYLQARGRNITIEAANITAGTILARTFGAEGNAGSINLKTTAGDITIAGIDVVSLGLGGGNAGNITIDSKRDFTVSVLLRAFSDFANGGDVLVNANGNISFNCTSLYAGACGVETFPGAAAAPLSGLGNSGNISIKSENGSIFMRNNAALNAASGSDGITGSITLSARDDINIETGFISTALEFNNGRDSGNVTITSTNGNINMSNSRGIFTRSASGQGGAVSINAFDNINLNVNNASATSGGLQTSGGRDSGAFSLKTTTGNITVTSIDTTASSISTPASVLGGNAGKISIESAGSVTVEGLLRAFSQSGNGADVSVKANNGNILFSCATTLAGKCGVETFPQSTDIAVSLRAGNIELLSPNGSITMNGNSILDAGADSQSVAAASTAIRNSGTVRIEAKGDIVTGLGGIATDVSYNNNQTASNINITSSEGNITVFNLNSSSYSGRGGDVSLSARNGTIGAYFVQDSSNPTFVQSIVTGSSLGIAGGNITFDGKFILDPLLNPNLDTSLASKIQPQVTLNTSAINSGNITFTSTIDGAKILNIIANTGTVDLQGAIGSTTPLTGVTIAAQTTNLKGNITTANSDITLNSLLTTTAASTLNAGTGTISLNGGLAAGGNAVSAIADQINLTAPITGTNTLILKPSSANRNIVLGGTDSNSFNLTSTAIASITGVMLSIGDASVGSISVTAPITFNTSATLISPVGINLNADITTTGQALTLTGNTRLGTNIAINSNNGDISTNGTVNSLTGNNFGLTLDAGTGNINLNGALGASDRLITISLNASNISMSGGINTTNGLQISNPTTITGTSTLSTLNGDINIVAPINIQAGTAANLTINAATGNVTTQDINLASAVGAGNSLTLLAPQGIVNTGNLNVNGTSGGNINIQALTSITTGTLSAVGLSGSGGNIFLDPLLDIFTGAINAQGFGGVGGTVDLTSNRFVRISGTFIDQNGLVASISTAGTAGDGVIIIRHDGGTRFEPFNVFSSLINGTDGVLTTGAGNTIFTARSFPGPYTQGNIQIITAPNFTIFLATQPLKEPPRVQWVDEGDRAPFPPKSFTPESLKSFSATLFPISNQLR